MWCGLKWVIPLVMQALSEIILACLFLILLVRLWVDDMHMLFLMSVRSGIKLCKKFKIQNIVLETNFPLVSLVDTGINALPCAPSLFYFRCRIIEGLNCLYHSFFVINEKVNAVAQALAITGTMFKNYTNMNMDHIPIYIQGLLNLDQMGFPYVYH
ncbi:hypothetical protein MA16_Dca024526 [Dendrobium catenatum]|uniref:RNase H type-1 domain-containing protein n=1 Tax=Dendrobium catenatum TaxID=906689 RepID=A0A2I0VI58_9ASPA|nr:hypothetical protein MA16_Dca024526 [Dendrobium catenatum]